MGCRRPSHSLKSPTTLTRSAFGAHTMKPTPDAVDYHRMCAQLFIEAQVPALGDQVHVDLAQDRGKPVGVVDGAAFPARLPFAFIELGSC